MGLCVLCLHISLLMIVRICEPYLVTILKEEVWHNCHCLRLGHEKWYALYIVLYILMPRYRDSSSHSNSYRLPHCTPLGRIHIIQEYTAKQLPDRCRSKHSSCWCRSSVTRRVINRQAQWIHDVITTSLLRHVSEGYDIGNFVRAFRDFLLLGIQYGFIITRSQKSHYIRTLVPDAGIAGMDK